MQPGTSPSDRVTWFHRGGLLNRPRVLPSVFDLRRHDTRAQAGSGAPGGGEPPAPAVSPPPINMAMTGPVPGILPAPEPRPPPEVAGSMDCPFVDDCSELVDKICAQPGVQDAGTCKVELWNVLQQYVYSRFPTEEFEPRIRAVAYKHGIEDLDHLV